RGSCCNLMDCRPTQSRMVGDHYEVKVDGAWTPVPYDKINNVVAPDGGAHAPRQMGPNKGVLFWVILPFEGLQKYIALLAAPREAAIAAFPRSWRGIGNGQADDDTQPTGPRDFVLRRDRHCSRLALHHRPCAAVHGHPGIHRAQSRERGLYAYG